MTIFEIPLVAIVSHPDNPRVFRDRDEDDPTETSTAGVCRVCGCTEDNACEMESGEPCHWVEPDLCSACVEEDTEAAE